MNDCNTYFMDELVVRYDDISLLKKHLLKAKQELVEHNDAERIFNKKNDHVLARWMDNEFLSIMGDRLILLDKIAELEYIIQLLENDKEYLRILC